MSDRRIARCTSRSARDTRFACRLTERDIAVIKMVALHRAVSREQLQILCGFNSVSRANRRLRQLFDAEYLRRTQIPLSTTALGTVYLLAPKGALLIAQVTDLDATALARQARRQPGRMHIEHCLGLVDIRIETLRAKGLRVLEFAAEPECLHEYEVRRGYRTIRRKIKPDGFVLFQSGQSCTPFFLEFDRGHVSLPRMRKVFERYSSYLNDGAFSAAYGLATPFEVLVITTAGDRRIRHFCRFDGDSSVRIRFATFGDLKASGFEGRIWRGAHLGAPSSLFEEPTVGGLREVQ